MKTIPTIGAPNAMPRALMGHIMASASDPRALRNLDGFGRPPVMANGGGDTRQLIESLTASVEGFKERYDGKLNAFTDRAQKALDEVNSRLTAMGVNGSRGGRKAALRAAREAFGDFAKSGSHEAIEAMAALAPQAALQVGSKPDGGYLIPQELDRNILELERNFSPMRRLCRVVQTKSAKLQIPVNLQGTGSGWVGETASRPQTASPGLAMLEFPAGEIFANPAVTQQLLDDAPQDIAAWLEGEIATEFDQQEAVAFLAGNGTNKPIGMLTGTPTAENDAVRAFGTYGYVPSGVAATVTADSLISLAYSLRAGYRRNGAWMMNSTTLGKVRGFKDGQGQYLWQPSLIEGQPERILGYPVEANDDMPDVAAGSFPIAFGDFGRGYLITDRVGTRILRDPYSNKPFVLFYATKRVGGGPLDTRAIRLMKVGTA